MHSLLLMIQFMTRYPVAGKIEFTAQHFIKGMKWMPLVGLLVGIPASLVVFFAEPLLGKPLASIFAIIILIVVTGGLHLDGIGDTADGLFSYRSPEEMLRIMRDSTLGTNGVIAIILIILLQYLTVSAMPAKMAALALLAADQVGGRHPHVVKVDIAGVGATLAHLLVGQAQADAGALGVDDEGRHPTATLDRRISARHQREQPGLRCVGDVALAAIDHVVITVPDGGGAQRRRV